MTALSFEGQRAVITGAGKGIGRAHAIDLASRGAAVLVNDVDRASADAVVGEIVSAGGTAVANYDAVGPKAVGDAIVDQAMQELGGVEIVINNAGFLRNALFEDMTEAQFDAIIGCHLMGTIYVTQAAWPIMQRQQYGRVILTSSSSGMFSHQGLSNYAAAKGGTYGLLRALAYEGKRHNIQVNCLLPASPTTIADQDPIPEMVENYAQYVTPEMFAKLAKTNQSQESIAAIATWLVSRDCDVNGEAFSIRAGRFGRVFVGVADGWLSNPEDAVSAESIRDHMDAIRDTGRYSIPMSIFEEVRDVAQRL